MEAQIRDARHQLQGSILLFQLLRHFTHWDAWTEQENGYVTANAHINNSGAGVKPPPSYGCLTDVQLGLNMMSALIKLKRGNPIISTYSLLDDNFRKKKKASGWLYTAKPSWEKCANMSHQQLSLYFQSAGTQTATAITRPQTLSGLICHHYTIIMNINFCTGIHV